VIQPSEYNPTMSYADIQAQATLLPLAERIELTRYLTALETEDDLRVLLSQRMRSMDAGRSVSLDAFKEKHGQLEAEGR
jgi:hypothetical protein